MILFVSDLHCQLELVNAQIEHAEDRIGGAMEAVIVPGDLGLFDPVLHRHFRRQGKRFLRPVHFIEGNHEDFPLFNTLVARYGDVLNHLPRGSLHTIGGLRFLALGGVSYMDPIATPPGSVIAAEDIQRSLSHDPGAVEVVLSHDCPQGLEIPHAPGFEHYGPVGFEGSESIRRRYRPRLWFFGHHHRPVDVTIEGTRCIGLPQGWCGYGLLDACGGYEYVPHPISRPPSTWARVRSRFGWRLRGTAASSGNET